MAQALASYGARERRFGRTSEQVTPRPAMLAPAGAFLRARLSRQRAGLMLKQRILTVAVLLPLFLAALFLLPNLYWGVAA